MFAKTTRVVSAAIVAMILLSGAAGAETVWQVATVNGTEQFSISPDATTLTYAPQPIAADYLWYQNNGTAPGTVAMYNSQVRRGSRTFATTNVAAGQALDSLKLQFSYDTALGYVTINFFMTDGAGHYGIFAPTSAGLASVATYAVNGSQTTMTVDLTNAAISGAASVAVYEHNGLVNEYGDPYTSMTWDNIKHYQIAGMYDYQRSPTDGWGAWGTMFDQINTAGSTTIVNGYGLALIWGDTVGNLPYSTTPRVISNPVVSFGGVDYLGTFADATVPEPATMTLLGLGLAGLLARRRK